MKVLVLCTGNSCRSIMAEALFNYLGQGRFQAWSAGSHPVGYVHPASLTTLQRHGVSPGQPRSKSWDEMASRPFDLVITVCDQAAAETCPSFAGHTRTLHWSIPDPGRVTGTEDEVNAAFDQTFSCSRKEFMDWWNRLRLLGQVLTVRWRSITCARP